MSDLTEGMDIKMDISSTAASPRHETRDGARAVHEARSPTRSGAVAVGRDGQTLRRTRQSGIDQFNVISAHLIPAGWSYQWNPVMVTGNTDIVRNMNLEMSANGWTAVPADRHPGVFMPVGYKGEIIVGGMRLEERPAVLTKEAQQEDQANARSLIRDRNESLKLSKVAANLPDGYAPLEGGQRRMLRTGGDNVRMSIDTSLDGQIPRPQYQPPED